MPAPPIAADHRDERTDTAGTTFGVWSCRYVYTKAEECGIGFEWNAVAILDNYATLSERRDNCASYVQANKYGDGHTWAQCVENCDMSFGAQYGPQLAQEADMWTNGPDPYGWRIAHHTVIGDARRVRTGEARHEWTEAACAYQASNNGFDSNCYWRDAFRAANFWQSGLRLEGGTPASPAQRGVWFSGGAFVIGLDFTGSTFQSVIRLGSGQKIALEGTDSVTIGLSGSRVCVQMLGKSVFEVDIHSGDVYARGELRKLD